MDFKSSIKMKIFSNRRLPSRKATGLPVFVWPWTEDMRKEENMAAGGGV